MEYSLQLAQVPRIQQKIIYNAANTLDELMKLQGFFHSKAVDEEKNKRYLENIRKIVNDEKPGSAIKDETRFKQEYKKLPRRQRQSLPKEGKLNILYEYYKFLKTGAPVPAAWKHIASRAAHDQQLGIDPVLTLERQRLIRRKDQQYAKTINEWMNILKICRIARIRHDIPWVHLKQYFQDKLPAKEHIQDPEKDFGKDFYPYYKKLTGLVQQQSSSIQQQQAIHIIKDIQSDQNKLYQQLVQDIKRIKQVDPKYLQYVVNGKSWEKNEGNKSTGKRTWAQVQGLKLNLDKIRQSLKTMIHQKFNNHLNMDSVIQHLTDKEKLVQFERKINTINTDIDLKPFRHLCRQLFFAYKFQNPTTEQSDIKIQSIDDSLRITIPEFSFKISLKGCTIHFDPSCESIYFNLQYYDQWDNVQQLFKTIVDSSLQSYKKKIAGFRKQSSQKQSIAPVRRPWWNFWNDSKIHPVHSQQSEQQQTLSQFYIDQKKCDLVNSADALQAYQLTANKLSTTSKKFLVGLKAWWIFHHLEFLPEQYRQSLAQYFSKKGPMIQYKDTNLTISVAFAGNNIWCAHNEYHVDNKKEDAIQFQRTLIETRSKWMENISLVKYYFDQYISFLVQVYNVLLPYRQKRPSWFKTITGAHLNKVPSVKTIQDVFQQRQKQIWDAMAGSDLTHLSVLLDEFDKEVIAAYAQLFHGITFKGHDKEDIPITIANVLLIMANRYIDDINEFKSACDAGLQAVATRQVEQTKDR